MQTAQPFIPETSSFKLQTSTEQLTWYKPQGIHEIWKIQSKQDALYYVIRYTKLLILLGIRNNYHSRGSNLLCYLLIRRLREVAVIIIEEYHCYRLHRHQSSTPVSRETKLTGEIKYAFRGNRSLLIRVEYSMHTHSRKLMTQWGEKYCAMSSLNLVYTRI
jgi:hypothetical protein